MSKRVYVVPAPVAEGELPRVATHPDRAEPLTDAGDFWPDDFFTASRLRGGDVVAVDPPETSEPPSDPPGDPEPPRRTRR